MFEMSKMSITVAVFNDDSEIIYTVVFGFLLGFGFELF